MSGPANVQSTEAVESVRNALVEFGDRVDQARTLLDQEIRRVLDWLEHDRPRFWKAQIHRATDEVAEAQAALHRCLMFPVADERPSCHEERAAVRKAQARLRYCQQKAERLQHWIREVRREMFQYEGRMSRLARITEEDVPQAVALLARLLRRLEEYEGVGTGAAGSPAAQQQLVDQLFPHTKDRPS